jgi:hypothetical protein
VFSSSHASQWFFRFLGLVEDHREEIDSTRQTQTMLSTPQLEETPIIPTAESKSTMDRLRQMLADLESSEALYQERLEKRMIPKANEV